MAMSWADVLIDPALASYRGKDDPLKATIALLLDGRLDEYERRAPTVGLPSLASTSMGDLLEPEGRLASAIVLLTGGQPESARALEDLATDRQIELGLRMLAAVLFAVAVSGGGRPDLSTPMLEKVRAEAQEPLDRAILDLHLATQAAEVGRYVNAAELAESVEDTLTDLRSASGEAARALAAHSAWQFSWYSGQRKQLSLPRKASSTAIVWVDVLAADALHDYLDGHFQSFFDNPYVRTTSFRREDATERGLARALFRAECLADWVGIARLRKSLGRYRLLSEAGRTAPGAAYGFQLLRRGGDNKGLERALGVFHASGPLEPLREVAETVAAVPWWPLELRSNLTVLAGAGFALNPRTAENAATRLLIAIPELTHPVEGAGWVLAEALNALAGVAPAAGRSTQRKISEALIDLASEPPEPMLHQSMGRAIHALDWELLGRGETQRWIQYVESHLVASDDHIFPAIAAAHELMALRPGRISALAVRAFRETRSLYLVSLLLRARRISAGDRAQVEAGVRIAATSMRERSRRGEYSIGVIAIGGLLGRLAIDRGSQVLMSDAVDFALDPSLPLDERLAVAGAFLESPNKVPQRYRLRLSNGLPSPTMDLQFFGTPDELAGGNLRLRATFGKMTKPQALNALLELIHSPTQRARLEAIESLPFLEEQIEEDSRTILLLGLAHDADPYVRAAAGHSLARTAVRDPALSNTRLDRVRALLDDPGALVPQAVWYGLADRLSPDPMPEDIRLRAQLVSSSHIAYGVRRAAAGFRSHG